jgi:FkbM family methyltransferase
MTSTEKVISFKFDQHGLGDVVHACHAVQLFKARGYRVRVKVESNKAWLWRAAGVEIVEEDLPNHGYEYKPGLNEFFDLNQPDSIANKVAGFFEHDALPRLASKKAVWDEVCRTKVDVLPSISVTAHAEAEVFLAGLPHPIIAMHSRGTNWGAEKSIPTDVAFNVIVALLRNTGGSVVVLDWDSRAPMIGHPHCKCIYPAWGKIDPERLCALLICCDFMLGIDSGPFHVASMLGVKSLGVFRKIPAVRCCLPAANSTYLVPSKDRNHWSRRRGEWNFIEYVDDSPTSDEIVDAVERLVSPWQLVPFSSADIDSVTGMYTYRRIGYDERRLELLPNGMIGTGAAGCERRWAPAPSVNGWRIQVLGDCGDCRFYLDRCSDGVLRGRWLFDEQMRVELVPTDIPLVVAKTSSLEQEQQFEDVPSGETRKSCLRRLKEGWFAEHVRLPGIDIGCEQDPLLDDPQWILWDRIFGSGCAQKMIGVEPESFATVYASHVLEHMECPTEAIQSWFRILMPGGRLIICVPHRDLYEKQKRLPSRWNDDHKTMWLPDFSEYPSTIGLTEFLGGAIPQATILSIRVLDADYQSNGDQHPSGEFSIEAILEKPFSSQAPDDSSRLPEVELSQHDGVWVRTGLLGMQDIEVVNDVIQRDSYRLALRESYGNQEVVIDIGGHIGTFAMAWHKKNPRARIVCVEACPENIPVLTRNVGHFATVIHAACSYELGELALLNSIMPNGTATGGSTVLLRSELESGQSFGDYYWNDVRPLRKITLEEIMREFSLDRIDVLKLDCEGSEFSILENSTVVHGVKFICGEYHGQANWDSLRKQLFSNWDYGHMWASNDLGIFHLENRSITALQTQPRHKLP